MMIPDCPQSKEQVRSNHAFSIQMGSLVVASEPDDKKNHHHQREDVVFARAEKKDAQSIATEEDEESEPDHRGGHKMNSQQALLPQDFHLTPYTVIIGKGKSIRENLGNKRLRVLSSAFLGKYSETTEKRTKTMVVNEIIQSIRNAGGNFVRKEKDGRWYEATDQAVREKIGYVFRDLLSDKYRSSSKSKVERRQKEQVGRASMRLERAMQMTYTTFSSDLPCSTSPSSHCVFTPNIPPILDSGERRTSATTMIDHRHDHCDGNQSENQERNDSYEPIPL